MISECQELRAWTTPYKNLKNRFEDVKSILPEAFEVQDEAMIEELTEELNKLKKIWANLKSVKCFQVNWTTKIAT